MAYIILGLHLAFMKILRQFVLFFSCSGPLFSRIVWSNLEYYIREHERSLIKFAIKNNWLGLGDKYRLDKMCIWMRTRLNSDHQEINY